VDKRPIIDAGILTAFIGAVATLSIALVGSADKSAQSHAQTVQQAQSVVADEQKAVIQAQKDVCVAALGYLGDETPNTSIPAEYRRRLLASVERSLESCSLPALGKDATANIRGSVTSKPAEPAGFVGGGGSAGGGGSGADH
jgi:hypothetical protein